MKYILILTVILLSGWVIWFTPSGDPSEPAPASGSYRNVTWDGHLLIEFGEGKFSGGIMHHPGCPCRGEQPEKEKP